MLCDNVQYLKQLSQKVQLYYQGTFLRIQQVITVHREVQLMEKMVTAKVLSLIHPVVKQGHSVKS